MRIGILGAGNMADALGGRWAAAGHEVMVGGRDPRRAARLAQRLNEGLDGRQDGGRPKEGRPKEGPAGGGPARGAADGARVRAGSLAEAAAFGADAVLLAVHAEAAVEVVMAVASAGAPLSGRTLIDCTNAVEPGRFTLAAPMAERIAEAAPGAHVVKAFNLCHVDVWRLDPPVFDGRPLAVPVCGADPAALATVHTLVTDLGCTPVAGGGPERAGLLEATAAFVIGLWLGAGADARAMLPPLAHSGVG
ncbi:NADPH-dependent F420 reductase [Streptomyces sp. 4N509B]|uniref:NADPH-dependent F420 reductase n=1 Tax=Streptomyces sp. 4N509B TaxID=3457413 RepID=UPI003FD5726F